MTLRLIGGFTFCLLLGGCAERVSERPVGRAITVTPPLGLPPVPVPGSNPVTLETVALGKRLFFDPRLSGDDSVSCASCHNPKHGFADGRRTAMGMKQQTGTRNAPTIINAAYFPQQFWDGRAGSLEEQAAGPIGNPIEMSLPHDPGVVKLRGDAEYERLFRAAFGDPAITMGRVQKALAAYERTILSGNSPFDRYVYGGDKNAMPEAAIRGLALFRDPTKGNCTVCHLIRSKSALLMDGLYHNIGAGLSPEGELTDLGRYMVTKVETDKGAFKTPGLRNVAQTAPYMHDGSLKTLRAVVDFYAGGGSSNPYLDREIKPLPLTGRDREDLVAFLESLTGELAEVQ